MVEGIIRKLYLAGIREIVVNVHHYAEQVIDFLGQLGLPGLEIYISDERECLMDTGGAILQAREQFQGEESFLVHNVDVWTNLDISALMKAHRKEAPLVTMAVKKRSTSRSLLFDQDGLLAGWRHNETGEERILAADKENLEDYGNSCIQIIHTKFLDLQSGTEPRPLVPMFLDLAAEHKIISFVHNDDYWYDLGRYRNFLKAEQDTIQIN
jgi:NDP-sugar pyrophosphorylase family protein